MNERVEIWQGMKDHDSVAVMDRACNGEAPCIRMQTRQVAAQGPILQPDLYMY